MFSFIWDMNHWNRLDIIIKIATGMTGRKQNKSTAFIFALWNLMSNNFTADNWMRTGFIDRYAWHCVRQGQVQTNGCTFVWFSTRFQRIMSQHLLFDRFLRRRNHGNLPEFIVGRDGWDDHLAELPQQLRRRRGRFLAHIGRHWPRGDGGHALSIHRFGQWPFGLLGCAGLPELLWRQCHVRYAAEEGLRW